eukprot:TRINITY_DN2528_c0_g1_i1.p1 TRINITY_DN2528_c0_g1~~TRINITY_DN2528_c0_g1_i1.p1  ORF type:complete len:436 (-),score=98.14 TRINITY_DN2528_c0_g1_i1:118-1425(-)
MVLKVIDYKEEDIGPRIKLTKKRYLWTFEIDGKRHTVELHYSLITGRIKIFSDGVQIYDETKFLSSSFQYPFTIDVNMLNLLQHGDTFELRINNQVFAHLYNQERTRREFGGEEEESSGHSRKDDRWSSNKDEDRWGSKKEDDRWNSRKGDDKWGLKDTNNSKKSPWEDSKEEKDDDLDFGKFAVKLSSIKAKETKAEVKAEPKNNNFGDFKDFSNFSFNPPSNKKTSEVKEKPKAQAPPPNTSNFDFDFGDFGSNKKKTPAPAPAAAASKNVDLLDLDTEPQKPSNPTPSIAPVQAPTQPQQQTQSQTNSLANVFDQFGFGPANPPQDQSKPAPPANIGASLLSAYNTQPVNQNPFQFGGNQMNANAFNNWGAPPAQANPYAGAMGFGQQPVNFYPNSPGGMTQSHPVNMFGMPPQTGSTMNPVAARPTPFDIF